MALKEISHPWQNHSCPDRWCIEHPALTLCFQEGHFDWCLTHHAPSCVAVHGTKEILRRQRKDIIPTSATSMQRVLVHRCAVDFAVSGPSLELGIDDESMTSSNIKEDPLERSDQSVFADFEEALAKIRKGPRPDASKLAGAPFTFVHQEPNHSTSSPAVRTDPLPSAASYRPSPTASLPKRPNIPSKLLQPVPFTHGEYAFAASQRDSSSDFVADIGYPHNANPPSPDLDIYQDPGGEHEPSDFFMAPADYNSRWDHHYQLPEAAFPGDLLAPTPAGEETLTIEKAPSPTKDADMEDADQWVHVDSSDAAPPSAASTASNAPAASMKATTSPVSAGGPSNGHHIPSLALRPSSINPKVSEVTQKRAEKEGAGAAAAASRPHGGTIAGKGKAVLLGSVETGMDCDIVDSLGRTVGVELGAGPRWIL
ncbi:hypothetical protein BDZ85DRAFT_33220 [Elsinoe ampelina]|uniref:Uncharacterized protein n=1 Tax=Elsinoe ampelina TaxID=302913 RepID=A0A6A6G3Q5_9PEZI|nr:hypothetical protein BDZ85DRAFT_33220 [Elsinoe ampelina]